MVLLLLAKSLAATVTTNTTKSPVSLSENPKDLKSIGDEAILTLHKELKKSIELRNRVFSSPRGLRNIDMTAFLKKKYRSSICAFGWRNGKYGRLFGKYLKMANALSKAIANKKKKKKRPLVPLYNRYHHRKVAPDNMECMLYARIHSVTRNVLSRILTVVITFMSPCMPNTITRTFMVKKIRLNNNTVLVLNMGKKSFWFEFDEKLVRTGYGINRREIYTSFKLLNYYTAFIPKFKRPPRRKSLGQILAQYEQLSKTGKLSRKLIDKHIRHPRKLKQERVRLVRRRRGKREVRMLYKNWRFRWLPYVKAGNKFVILSPGSNIRPFHPYPIIYNVWTGSNPTHCVSGYNTTKYTRMIMYRDIPFMKGRGRFGNHRVRMVYRVPKKYFKMVCAI